MNQENVIQLDLPLKNLIHISKNSHKDNPTIFFLHGFGSNMQDLFGLRPFFGDNWNCISLQANIQIMYDGWGWAELDPINIRKLPKPKQITFHHELISESIEKTISLLELDQTKINLLGFSQGASLSIYCGLNNPEKFRAIVALCGYVPEDNIRQDIDEAKERDIEIFMGNGTLDQIVSVPIARASRDYLNSVGISLYYKEYESGHTIPNDCLNDTIHWLNQKNNFDLTSDDNFRQQQYHPNSRNYPTINKKPH